MFRRKAILRGFAALLYCIASLLGAGHMGAVAGPVDATGSQLIWICTGTGFKQVKLPAPLSGTEAGEAEENEEAGGGYLTVCPLCASAKSISEPPMAALLSERSASVCKTPIPAGFELIVGRIPHDRPEVRGPPTRL